MWATGGPRFRTEAIKQKKSLNEIHSWDEEQKETNNQTKLHRAVLSLWYPV